MPTARSNSRSGVALIITMICITVLGGMAALFAISMKTETRLAMNANADADFYALAQSAVDYCRSVLAISCPEEQFDALTQPWAGGSGSLCSNELFNVIKHDVDLGYGSFHWDKMVDQESMANINQADQPMLEQAMRLLGVEAGDSEAAVASILDWIDRDKNPHMNGVESDYYEGIEPQPYKAKDGYMDDIQELEYVRGVTPEMFGDDEYIPPPPPPSLRDRLQLGFAEKPVQRAKLKNLFTPISGGPININTASREVLQLVPFIDENVADRIVQCRDGQDTGQPTPFRNPGEALLCAGLNQQIVGQIQRYFTVRSQTFKVIIDVKIGAVTRYYTAVLSRKNPRDIQVLLFYWSLEKPKPLTDGNAR